MRCDLVKDFTKCGDHGTDVSPHPASRRICRHQRGGDHPHLPSDPPPAADRGKADTVRIGHARPRGRAISWWPMPFGTACCAIEFMATAASKFDLARFGMERMSFSPRQADVLICAGRVPFKLAPVIRRIWQQMPQPKWCISMGACASSGGMFDNYAVVQGIDTIIPVDVYVPGCPPRPEGLLYGIMMLQEKVMRERMSDRWLRNEMHPDPSSELYIPPPDINELGEPFGNSVHQNRSAP